MQIDFVIELFEAARKKDIHTCVDTSGITFQKDNPEYLKKLDRLLQSTNLVMLDIKHIDDFKHKSLTGQSNVVILSFARYLYSKQIPVWIRHVVVPQITDQASDLYHLGRFIGELKNVKALDVLPYHDMGKIKYDNLGLDYPLKDTPPMSKEGAIAAKKIILSGIRDTRIGKPDPYCS
jgi:pyruvate formate lyase activating enzyme